MLDYDTELVRYATVLHRAAALRPGDRVLDVGCGAGRTTRDAARAAPGGHALGVDVSAEAVERARAADGPADVAFEVADAQTHPFPPAGFDVVISRFGTMFFADPAAAFANLARALRPGGRLVMIVWQAGERNAWHVLVRDTLGTTSAAAPAFSLADPAVVEPLLRAAGFTGVRFTDLREPVCYGPDPDAAVAFVRQFAGTPARSQEPATDDRFRRLHEALTRHWRPDGVWLDARAWLVTASRPELP